MPGLRPPKQMDPTQPETQARLKRARDVTPDWLETISDFMFGKPEDPNSMLQMGMPPMPAVSVFAKPGMGRGAREVFTEATKENVQRVIRQMGIGAEEAAKMLGLVDKYPRISAHLTDVVNLPNEQGGLANFQPGFRPGMGSIALTNRAKNEPAHSLAHEMTHAAQNVSLKDKFKPSYDEATQLAGYLDNPLERNARMAADHKVPLDPTGALDQIWKQVGRRRPGPQPATAQLRKLREGS